MLLLFCLVLAGFFALLLALHFVEMSGFVLCAALFSSSVVAYVFGLLLTEICNESLMLLFILLFLLLYTSEYY